MALIEFETVGVTRPGETQSGDRHLVQPFDGGVLVGVVDGIGHGEEAAIAAKEAVAALREHASDPLVSLLQNCHQRLRPTRGVVLSLASFNARGGTMTWLGVGNVEGIFFRADPRSGTPPERLLLRGGVVGKLLPPVRPATLPLLADDVLILATDGVRSDFACDKALGGPLSKVANHIIAWHHKRSDDALVLVARYLGEKS